jgi:hypothetical protein
MAGGDVVVIAGGIVEHDPFFIHRVRHDIGVGQQKGVNGLAEAGILDANAGLGDISRRVSR